MCGIVAYVGPRQAHEIIIKGLKRLEYRGYDSAGIALLNGSLNVYKKKGKVTELEDSLKGQNLNSHIGMGHTRWATHGEPNNVNAHPHYSNFTIRLRIKKIAILKKCLTETLTFYFLNTARQRENFKSGTLAVLVR